MTKLSVLLPIYNGVSNYPAGCMVKSIESVLNLHCDKEVIVIDDGSIDNTVNHLYRHFGNSITVLRNAKNSGQAVALNKGLQFATGDYIWQWSVRATAEERASELVDALDNDPNIGFISGQMYSYGGSKDYTHSPPHIFDRKRYIEKYLANFYIYRKMDGLKYGGEITLGDGRVIGICDRDMLMQLIERGAVGASLHDVLCVSYFNGGHHTMRDVSERRHEIDKAFRKKWEHLK